MKENPRLSFSLFFFASDSEEDRENKYGSLLRMAEFADERGFEAIWTPERHFHRFGGLFPNPSVLSAAIAMKTKRIRIRAGSVSLPNHHPVRVAEEWSIVDNLSAGRVDLSFTYGWHPKEFIFAPEQFDNRKEIMFDSIDVLKRLWEGKRVTFPSAANDYVIDKIYPEPVQKTLPIWITTSRSAESWSRAGEIGANILTALYAIDMKTLERNIAIYRQARARSGFSSEGIVSLMMHSYIGKDLSQVRDSVREPMIQYLLRHTELYDLHSIARELKIDPAQLNDKHRRTIASMAFERYLRGDSLIGTPESCSERLEYLRSNGVNEIACLVDFGIGSEPVMESLYQIDRLRTLYS